MPNLLSKFEGEELDLLLGKALEIHSGQNGWTKLVSSETEILSLNSLLNPGNFAVEYWQDGPVELAGMIGKGHISLINYLEDDIVRQYAFFRGITRDGYIRTYDKSTKEFTNWQDANMKKNSHLGPNEPAEEDRVANMIWVDTSTENSPIFKYWNEITHEWAVVDPADMLKASVYDPSGKGEDFFAYADRRIKEVTTPNDEVWMFVNKTEYNPSLKIWKTATVRGAAGIVPAEIYDENRDLINCGVSSPVNALADARTIGIYMYGSASAVSDTLYILYTMALPNGEWSPLRVLTQIENFWGSDANIDIRFKLVEYYDGTVTDISALHWAFIVTRLNSSNNHRWVFDIAGTSSTSAVLLNSIACPITDDDIIIDDMTIFACNQTIQRSDKTTTFIFLHDDRIGITSDYMTWRYVQSQSGDYQFSSDHARMYVSDNGVYNDHIIIGFPVITDSDKFIRFISINLNTAEFIDSKELHADGNYCWLEPDPWRSEDDFWLFTTPNLDAYNKRMHRNAYLGAASIDHDGTLIIGDLTDNSDGSLSTPDNINDWHTVTANGSCAEQLMLTTPYMYYRDGDSVMYITDGSITDDGELILTPLETNIAMDLRVMQIAHGFIIYKENADTAFSINVAGNAINETVEDHINDSEAHITAEELAYWNNKASKKKFSDAIANATSELQNEVISKTSVFSDESLTAKTTIDPLSTGVADHIANKAIHIREPYMYTTNPPIGEENNAKSDILWTGEQYVKMSFERTKAEDALYFPVHMYTSPDGLTWTECETNATEKFALETTAASNANNNYKNSAYARVEMKYIRNQIIILVGPRCYVLDDISTGIWKTLQEAYPILQITPEVEGTAIVIGDIAYGGGRMVITTNMGIYHWNNGDTEVVHSAIGDMNRHCLVYGNGMWIAVNNPWDLPNPNVAANSDKAIYMYSDTDNKWTRVYGTCRAIAQIFFNGKFILLQDDSKIIYSENGTDWITGVSLKSLLTTGALATTLQWAVATPKSITVPCPGSKLFAAHGTLFGIKRSARAETYFWSKDGLNWSITMRECIIAHTDVFIATSLHYNNGFKVFGKKGLTEFNEYSDTRAYLNDKADVPHQHNLDHTVCVTAGHVDGMIPLDQIPDGVRDVNKKVNSNDERLALTIDDVQEGDFVWVADTKLLYRVINEDLLGTEKAEGAFQKYSTGGSAMSWNNIGEIPQDIMGLGITDLDTKEVTNEKSNTLASLSDANKVKLDAFQPTVDQVSAVNSAVKLQSDIDMNYEKLKLLGYYGDLKTYIYSLGDAQCSHGYNTGLTLANIHNETRPPLLMINDGGNYIFGYADPSKQYAFTAFCHTGNILNGRRILWFRPMLLSLSNANIVNYYAIRVILDDGEIYDLCTCNEWTYYTYMGNSLSTNRNEDSQLQMYYIGKIDLEEDESILAATDSDGNITIVTTKKIHIFAFEKSSKTWFSKSITYMNDEYIFKLSVLEIDTIEFLRYSIITRNLTLVRFTGYDVNSWYDETKFTAAIQSETIFDPGISIEDDFDNWRCIWNNGANSRIIFNISNFSGYYVIINPSTEIVSSLEQFDREYKLKDLNYRVAESSGHEVFIIYNHTVDIIEFPYTKGRNPIYIDSLTIDSEDDLCTIYDNRKLEINIEYIRDSQTYDWRRKITNIKYITNGILKIYTQLR